MSKGKVIIAINLDTSSDNNNTSEKIDYDSPEYRGPPKSLLKWYGYLSDEYKDKGEIIVLSSNSSDDRKGPSKESVPIFEGPSIQGLLDHYGYNDIEEYLSWNYFLSTNKENTDKDITDNDIIDEDCIHKSKYAMSKGKYVPVSQKHNPKVKSHVPVTGCVLRLANITTWDEIVDKIGVRKSEIHVDKENRKRKLAFASKHLQLAFAG
ncbi:hypothetical protein Tco_0849266 [Tanacetum coccineum]